MGVSGYHSSLYCFSHSSYAASTACATVLALISSTKGPGTPGGARPSIRRSRKFHARRGCRARCAKSGGSEATLSASRRGYRGTVGAPRLRSYEGVDRRNRARAANLSSSLNSLTRFGTFGWALNFGSTFVMHLITFASGLRVAWTHRRFHHICQIITISCHPHIDTLTS